MVQKKIESIEKKIAIFAKQNNCNLKKIHSLSLICILDNFLWCQKTHNLSLQVKKIIILLYLFFVFEKIKKIKEKICTSKKFENFWSKNILCRQKKLWTEKGSKNLSVEYFCSTFYSLKFVYLVLTIKFFQKKKSRTPNL